MKTVCALGLSGPKTTGRSLWRFSVVTAPWPRCTQRASGGSQHPVLPQGRTPGAAPFPPWKPRWAAKDWPSGCFSQDSELGAESDRWLPQMATYPGSSRQKGQLSLSFLASLIPWFLLSPKSGPSAFLGCRGKSFVGKKDGVWVAYSPQRQRHTQLLPHPPWGETDHSNSVFKPAIQQNLKSWVGAFINGEAGPNSCAQPRSRCPHFSLYLADSGHSFLPPFPSFSPSFIPALPQFQIWQWSSGFRCCFSVKGPAGLSDTP